MHITLHLHPVYPHFLTQAFRTLPDFMQANEVQRSSRFPVRGKAKHRPGKHTHSLLGHHVVHDRAEVVGSAAVGTLAVIVDDEAVGMAHPLEACACVCGEGWAIRSHGAINQHRGR